MRKVTCNNDFYFLPSATVVAVMFSQASVILSTGEGVCVAKGEGGHACQGGGACVAGGRAWQERRPLQLTVCILLECILV